MAAFPGCRGLAVAHQGAVVAERGRTAVRSLDPGVGAIGHVSLDGPEAPLVAVPQR
ncbi:MAG: hypothetical protein ACRD1K_05555 [Acidimicrobiales bacterium]